MARSVRVIAWCAAISLFVATFVAHLEQTAQLPTVLVGDAVRHWTVSRTFAGVPLEFVVALWFLAVGTRRADNELQAVDALSFWSGIIVCALCVGLLYEVGLKCVPVTIGFVSALVAVVDSGLRLHRLPLLTLADLRGALRHNIAVLGRPRRLAKLVAAAAAVALAIQYLALTGAATTAADRDAQLTRWYESEPRLTTADLVAPNKIRVVAFSDYLCPACSFQIPAIEKTVNRYQMGGYQQVELVLKEFPLNADCNPFVTTKIHRLACQAAVAARVAQRYLEHSESLAFRGRLYARHGKLTEAELAQELDAVRLLQRYQETYDEELKAVEDDARLGGALGISATPTVFVDGRLLRSSEPRVLTTILSYLVRKGSARSDVADIVGRRK